MKSIGHIYAAALICAKLPKLCETKGSVLDWVRRLEQDGSIDEIERIFSGNKKQFPKELFLDRIEEIISGSGTQLSKEEIRTIAQTVLCRRKPEEVDEIIEKEKNREQYSTDCVCHTTKIEWDRVKDKWSEIFSWKADPDQIVFSADHFEKLAKNIKETVGNTVAIHSRLLNSDTLGELVEHIKDQGIYMSLQQIRDDIQKIKEDEEKIKDLIRKERNDIRQSEEEENVSLEDEAIQVITDKEVKKMKKRLENIEVILNKICSDSLLELEKDTDINTINGDSEIPEPIDEKYKLEYIIKKGLKEKNTLYITQSGIYTREEND